MQHPKEAVVISVGGSLIVPDDVNTQFVKEFGVTVASLLSSGYRVALVVGGGATSRRYHRSLGEFSHTTQQDADWLGVRAISLNAEFILRSFAPLEPHPLVLTSLDDISQASDSLMVIGAWEIGHSSDYNAVAVAEILGATRVLNLSNIDYVYDADPRINQQAQPLREISWADYLSMLPSEWISNFSSPFDPIASRKAYELGMKVVVLGPSQENIQGYLNGEMFEGTVIQ